MKNVAFVVVALGLVACNSSRPNVVDSGGIVLADTGGRDTGPTTADTGGGGTTCGSIASSTDVWPALPSTCLPRCAMATATAYNACASRPMAEQQACIDAALMADTRPGVSVDVGGGDSIPVSCGGDATTTFSCLDWQGLAAESMVCATTLGDFITCANGVPAGGSVQTACATQITARNMCITSNMAAFQSAFNTLGSACFG